MTLKVVVLDFHTLSGSSYSKPQILTPKLKGQPSPLSFIWKSPHPKQYQHLTIPELELPGRVVK